MIIRYLLEKLDKEEQGLRKVWAILQHIKETLELSEPSDSILASLNPEDYDIKIPPVQIIAVLEDLQKRGILKILKKNESTPSQNAKPVEIDRGKFNSEYKEVENRAKKEKLEEIQETEKFEITIKDREIWINDYLLSKPHAVGSNLEFFEYICSKPPNTLIARDKMPNIGDGIEYGYTKEAIKKKGFIKILNELGFKGEILKAFFPKRGKNIVVYRGNRITKKDLEKAGVKIPLFFKELEVAHLKNSPE